MPKPLIKIKPGHLYKVKKHRYDSDCMFAAYTQTSFDRLKPKLFNINNNDPMPGHKTFIVDPKAFPEPYPNMAEFSEKLGENMGFQGQYFKKNDDGTAISIDIGKISSGGDPRITYPESKDDYLFVNMDNSWTDLETGKVDEDWSWWTFDVKQGNLSVEGEGIDAFEFIDPKAETTKHFTPSNPGEFAWLTEAASRIREQREWRGKYIDGGYDSYDEAWSKTGVGMAIRQARNESKTTYFTAAEDFYYLTFSVKYFYRDRALEFCRAAKKLYRELKKAGYKPKVG